MDISKSELKDIAQRGILALRVANPSEQHKYLKVNTIIQALIDDYYEEPEPTDSICVPTVELLTTKEINPTDDVVIYVDGSYNTDTERVGFGIVITENGEFIEGFYGSADHHKSRNVFGEIKAATFSFNYAIKNALKSCKICYDYMGIEMWATHKWKANEVFTKCYQDFADDCKDLCDFTFEHIKSHTGDKFNELADALAKKSINLSDMTTEQKNMLNEYKDNITSLTAYQVMCLTESKIKEN